MYIVRRILFTFVGMEFTAKALQATHPKCIIFASLRQFVAVKAWVVVQFRASDVCRGIIKITITHSPHLVRILVRKYARYRVVYEVSSVK